MTRLEALITITNLVHAARIELAPHTQTGPLATVTHAREADAHLSAAIDALLRALEPTP